MRDRGMAKLFSFSCISASTTSLPAADDAQKPPKTPELADRARSPPPPPLPPGEELESAKKRRNMILKFMKSFSYLFSLSREDEEEEEEREMVIGFPTDVQHVAHIGWDGFARTATIAGADAKKKSTTTTDSSWAKGGPELLSLDSLSLKQFQAAMATLQAAAGR